MPDRYHFSLLLAFLFLCRLSLAQEFSALEPLEVATVNSCQAVQGNDSVDTSPETTKSVPSSTFDFSVYPNPAHSVVYLRLPVVPQEIAWIRLLDSKGQLIRQQELPVLLRSFSYNLPEGLAPGKYLIEIQSLTGYSRSNVTVCAY